MPPEDSPESDNLEDVVDEERNASAGDQSPQKPAFLTNWKHWLPWVIGIALALVAAYLLYRNYSGSNSSTSNSTSSSSSSGSGGSGSSTSSSGSSSNSGVAGALNSLASGLQQSLQQQQSANQQQMQAIQSQNATELSTLQHAMAAQTQQEQAIAQQQTSQLQQMAQAQTASQQQLANQVGALSTAVAQYGKAPAVSAPASAAPAVPTVNAAAAKQVIAYSQAPGPKYTVAPNAAKIVNSALRSPGFRSVAANMTPQETAVVAGASSAPLTSQQVSQIQQAQGGTPLTAWQKQFLETGGNTTIPAAPGSGSSTGTKYVNGVAQNG